MLFVKKTLHRYWISIVICIQWGSKVWAPQVKMCINVHNEAKERWKNLRKASNYRLDISYNMSKKVWFYFHHLYFQNDRKQKNGICKVWAPCRVNILYCPLWQVSQLVNAFCSKPRVFQFLFEVSLPILPNKSLPVLWDFWAVCHALLF